MPDSINASATLLCPHGGQVQIVSANARVNGGGAPLALSTDAFIVAGCPFQLPGPTPSPCVVVRWQVADQRIKINGAATVSRASTGICYSAAQAPQGPVTIVNTQVQVQTS